MADDYDALIPDASEEDEEAIEELLANREDSSIGRQTYLPGLVLEEDLTLNGSGNIVIGEEEDTWLTWCKKVLATPRYMCDEYSDQIGIDTESAFEAKTRAEAEEILKSEIKGALKADPYNRTANVESITFNWFAPDSVEVLTVVVGFDNIRATINTVLEANGVGE